MNHNTNHHTYKIGIIWANPYNKNLGVGALGYSCLALFHDILKEHDLKGDITLIGSNGKSRDTLVIDGKKIPVTNIHGMDFMHWKSFLKLVLQPRKYRTKRLMNFDIIFDIGEGDSFSDIYGEQRYKRLINSKVFFNKWNIPQVLLPQTIGPFTPGKREDKSFEVMKKMKKVIARDKKSFDYSSQHLSPDALSESIDVAFYLPFKKEKFSDNKIHVGINVSGLLWNGGYTKNNQFSLKSDYKTLMRSVLEYFHSMDDVQIHLVSHVVPVNHSIEDDYLAAEEIRKEYGKVILSPRFETPVQAKSYISCMDFFIGARMHSCIAAFSSGVPVFPMAYSRKFNGLFGETLNYTHYGDCVNQPEEVIMNNMKKAYRDRVTLKAEVDSSINEIVTPRLKKLKEQIYNTIIEV